MKMKDVAAALGLSQTTVSRALNGHSDVNEATRQRIVAAARRLGYSPNESARRLATGRSDSVAIVFPRSNSFGSNTLEFIGGLAERFGQEGLALQVNTVDGVDEELELYRRFAGGKRVDGVIVHTPRPEDERVALLSELKLPFVLHGRTKGPPHAFLDIDNEGAFRRACDHLLDLGHQRIGLINGERHLTFAIDREAGYRAAMAGRGRPVVPQWITNVGFSDEAGFTAARAMLESPRPPSAFLVGAMTMVLGVIRAIDAFGLVVGRDVSVIAHDDVFPFLNADNMLPPLSTTRSPLRAAGIRVATMLVQILAGRPATDMTEVWPVELVLRETTRPPAQGR